MLVSIVTPLYNASNWLEKTVESVLSQTLTDWEMLIVDDCSTDNSFELACRLSKKDERIKVFQLEKNAGAAVARNKAISEAKGRYIAFLDSDDLWVPQKLEKQLAFMKENNIAFSYSPYDKIDEKGQVFDTVTVPKRLCYSELLKTNYVGCLTAVYDTQKLEKVFMPMTTKREDFATWLLILKKIPYAYSTNKNLGQYRVYSNQSSAKKLKMAKENWYLYRRIEGFSILKSSYYFAHYSIRGFLRTKAPYMAKLLGY